MATQQTMITNSLIRMQEDLDYYVTKRLFEKNLPDCKLSQTPPMYSVDAIGKWNDYDFTIEIKSRSKNKEQQLLYPHAELRCDKYKRMRECSSGLHLFYVVLVNEEDAYIFNLDTIDMTELPIVDWTIKRTEYSSNPRTITLPIYQIPYNKATKLYCGDFFYDYFVEYGLDTEKTKEEKGL